MRLLVVDDHAAFREALVTALAEETDILVCGQGHDGRSAMSFLESTAVDVVLLDLALPGLSGVAVTREIKHLHKTTSVLVLTKHVSARSAADCFVAGALGYACKTATLAEVIGAIRDVAAGRRHLAREISDSAVAECEASDSKLKKLSVRELDVFDLAASGHSSKEIARHLCISMKTVESHRRSINRKLEVHSAVELVLFASRRKLPS